MSFLNWFYSRQGYYCLKSGVFVDFYVKRFFVALSKQLYIYLGILFLEKYVIEHYTKKITENLLFSFNAFLNFKKNYNFLSLKTTVFIFIFIFVTLLIILL